MDQFYFHFLSNYFHFAKIVFTIGSSPFYHYFTKERCLEILGQLYLHIHLHSLIQWNVHNLHPKVMGSFIKCCMSTYWNQSEKAQNNLSQKRCV